MSQSWDLCGLKTAETTSGNLWETEKSDFKIQECLFLHRCKAPPKLTATQTYGQGPAGTLTIGFEEQVKV